MNIKTDVYNYHKESLKRYNRQKGFYFFSPDTMRFFNSRLSSEIRKVQYKNNWMVVFITSEKFNDETPRAYTLRIMFNEGNIESLSEFQEYKSLNAAKRALNRFITAIETNTFTEQELDLINKWVDRGYITD